MVTGLYEPLEHSVRTGVSWEEYERVLEQFESESCRARITYNQGQMEVTTMGDKHERAKAAIGRLIETYGIERDIPVNCLGSVTLRRQDLLKGLEPDECFYVTTPLPPVPDELGAPLDLSIHPPPDLAIEVDITKTSIPRQPIYAALGIREVWRYDGQSLVFLKRTRDGRYEPTQYSTLLPRLSSNDLDPFVQMALNQSPHAAAKALRDWVRKQS